MKKTFLTLYMAVCATLVGNAQTDLDALRYSESSLTGTARYSSMGGAFGALGADFSAISSNPGSMALYRSSEFNLSMSLYNNHTASTYMGKTADENRFNFNVPSFGFVFTKQTNSPHQWKSWNFGIGLNRINNFQANTYYEGYNNGTMLDWFVEQANSNSLSEADLESLSPHAFYEGLAIQTQLIYLDTLTGAYTNDRAYYNKQDLGMFARRTGTTRGAQNEWNFSFGANYDDLLYTGISVGLRSIRYEDNSTYEEFDQADIPYVNNYSFNQDFVTTGSGVNVKLGVVLRPADWVRIGAAFHSPTFYSLSDSYTNTMSSVIDSFSTEPASASGAFDYNLTTPMKAVGSLGFVLGTSAVIGLEYEYTDYSNSRFDAPGASYSDVHDVIRTIYDVGNTFKAGGEYRFQNLAFRLGYNYSTSPFRTNYTISGEDYTRTNYSAGIGLRDSNYFLDVAYVLGMSNEHFQPYTLAVTDVPGVKNEIRTNNVVLTFGLKF